MGYCCEKCWGDAYMRMLSTGKSQADCYLELLVERVNNNCTKKEQSGQYWDEVNKCDRRDNNIKEKDENGNKV